MSTKLKKRPAGPLLAGLALSIAILAVLLPGWVEAQEVKTDAVSIETAQDTNNHQTSGADEVTTTAATTSPVSTSQGAYEPAAVLLVVEPGDSLWAIAQERLGPEATPQQVAQETGRIYGLNRERIGEDPNLIFPGQELLLTQGPEPAAGVSPTTGVAPQTAQEPAAGAPAGEEPATVEQPTAADEEALPDQTRDESAAENDEPSYPLPYYYGRQGEPGMLTVLISLGFFLAALAVAALAVAKLRRRRRLLGKHYGFPYEPSVPHDEPRQSERPEREADRKRRAPDVPGPTAEVRQTSEKK